MLDSIAMLERCGVDAIAIPCNTAHYWLPTLTAASRVPILSIVDAVVAEFHQRRVTLGRIGILGTAGMIRSGIYQAALAALGYDVLVPDVQQVAWLVEPAIRSIKAGDLEAATSPLAAVVEHLEKKLMKLRPDLHLNLRSVLITDIRDAIAAAVPNTSLQLLSLLNVVLSQRQRFDANQLLDAYPDLFKT